MGVKLTAALRKQLGLTKMGPGTRGPLKPAVRGAVRFHLSGAPPTATHHDKTIAQRGGRRTLVNSAALNAAHDYYAIGIPHTDTPIAGPIIAHVTWHFPLPAKPAAGEIAGAEMMRKPDRDNAAKVLFDQLALHGWILADEQVTDGPLWKLWARPGEEGVEIFLRTKLPEDDATLIPLPECGTLYPYPPQNNAERIEREYGTPGGTRRPESRPTGPRASSVVFQGRQRASKADGAAPGRSSPGSSSGRRKRSGEKRRGT